MRHQIFVLSTLVLALAGRAADQVITVTPQNLAGWTVTGANKNAMASASQLALPAGAQISQDFTGGAVILHLVSRPVFSDQPEDWPIIGLGSAALALIRLDGQGKLVLVLNETTATNLPWTVTLDPNAEQDPIEFFIAYDPASGAGLISFQGQVQSFDLAPSAKPTSVWLSAGATSTWSLDVLQVLLVDPSVNTTGTTGNLGANTTTPTTTAEKLQAVLSNLQAVGSVTGATGASTGGVTTTKAASSVSSLEVFTPPSVRRRQIVSAVRSAVAQAQAR